MNFTTSEFKNIFLWMASRFASLWNGGLGATQRLWVSVREMHTCALSYTCLVPRRLSFDENVRAKEGGKETTGFVCRLHPSHGPLRFITSHSPLAFRARLCLAKNEAPEEEAALIPYLAPRSHLQAKTPEGSGYEICHNKKKKYRGCLLLSNG